jgi:hypothetical protein
MAHSVPGWRSAAAVVASASLLVAGLDIPEASAAATPRVDLWTGLLLQSFGAVLGAAAVCCATALARTLALATYPGDPHGIGLLVHGVAAALQTGLVCGLLGRATAHR